MGAYCLDFNLDCPQSLPYSSDARVLSPGPNPGLLPTSSGDEEMGSSTWGNDEALPSFRGRMSHLVTTTPTTPGDKVQKVREMGQVTDSGSDPSSTLCDGYV